MNTLPLRHVSALKVLSLGSTTDKFQKQDQQNMLPDVKFALSNTVYFITGQNHVAAA
jgi:hypothetical protein